MAEPKEKNEEITVRAPSRLLTLLAGGVLTVVTGGNWASTAATKDTLKDLESGNKLTNQRLDSMSKSMDQLVAADAARAAKTAAIEARQSEFAARILSLEREVFSK